MIILKNTPKFLNYKDNFLLTDSSFKAMIIKLRYESEGVLKVYQPKPCNTNTANLLKLTILEVYVICISTIAK